MTIVIRTILTAFLITALCFSTKAQAIPRVILTIDVESNEIFFLPQQVDVICKGGLPCGLMEMARILRDRGLAATFFLNVYEYKIWGEPALRDIAG